MTTTPAPGVIQFKIFVNPFLVIITILSICLIYAYVKKEEGNNAFSLDELFGYALAQDPCPGGHEI